MSKKLLVVLALLLASTSALLFVIFGSPKNSSLETFTKKHFSPSPATTYTLSFLPGVLTVTPGQNASISIFVNANQIVSKDTLIQLEIGYDPTVINKINISPGNYLLKPEVLLKNIDYRTGRISYAMKGNINNANTSTNVAAVLSFNTTTYNLKTSTDLIFLPKTLMREDNKSVKITEMKGAKIIFTQVYSPKISTPSATPKL